MLTSPQLLVKDLQNEGSSKLGFGLALSKFRPPRVIILQTMDIDRTGKKADLRMQYEMHSVLALSRQKVGQPAR